MGVMLGPLSSREAAVLEAHAAGLGPAERESYDTYLAGPGMPIHTVDRIDLFQKLHRKGWVSRAPGLMDDLGGRVWLSWAAWQRLSTAEIAELEERARLEDESWGAWG